MTTANQIDNVKNIRAHFTELTDEAIAMVSRASVGKLKVVDGPDDYNLTEDDNGKFIVINSPLNLNVIIDFEIPEKFQCFVMQGGVGQIRFIGMSTHVRHFKNYNQTIAQFAVCRLNVTDNSELVLTGDVQPFASVPLSVPGAFNTVITGNDLTARVNVNTGVAWEGSGLGGVTPFTVLFGAPRDDANYFVIVSSVEDWTPKVQNITAEGFDVVKADGTEFAANTFYNFYFQVVAL